MRLHVAGACVALCIWSCGNGEQGGGAAPAEAPAAAPAASGAPSSVPAKTEALVTVRGKEITSADLAAYESGLPPSLQTRKQGEAAVRDLLQGLVDAELMVGEAESQGLDQDSKVMRLLHKHYVEHLSALLLQQVIGSKVQVTDAQIRQEYKDNLWNREIWPAHILLNTEDEAWEVVRKLREEGADFAEMARRYSKADDAELGGNLHNYFRVDDTASNVVANVFGLPVGAVSDPIRTRDGWEINKILADREVPLPEVYEKIGRLLHKQEFFRLHGRYVEDLEKAYKVSYHDDGLAALLRAAGAGQDELPAADQALPLVTYGAPPKTIAAGQAELTLRTSGLPLSLIADRDMAVRGLRQRVMADTLLVLEAESRGLEKNPAFVTEMTGFHRRLLIGELRRREVIANAEVTEEEMRKLYDEDKDEFYRPYLADATEILVPTRAEADSLLKRIAAGDDMKLLAAKHSKRPGAYHARGHLHLNAEVPEPMQPLFEAVKDAPAKKVLGPVKVPEGYSIVRVEQFVPAGNRSFEEVRHILQYKIKTRRIYDGFEDYIRRLRDKRSGWVDWHEDAIRRAGQARSS